MGRGRGEYLEGVDESERLPGLVVVLVALQGDPVVLEGLLDLVAGEVLVADHGDDGAGGAFEGGEREGSLVGGDGVGMVLGEGKGVAYGEPRLLGEGGGEGIRRGGPCRCGRGRFRAWRAPPGPSGSRARGCVRLCRPRSTDRAGCTARSAHGTSRTGRASSGRSSGSRGAGRSWRPTSGPGSGGGGRTRRRRCSRC